MRTRFIVACLSLLPLASGAAAIVSAGGALEELAPSWFVKARAEDSAALAALAAGLARVEATTEQLAEAVATQTIAERVGQCAPSTALLLHQPSSRQQCTAVPLFAAGNAPHGRGTSTKFLTSAHCFASPNASGAAVIQYQGAWHACSLAHLFSAAPPWLDLALVLCAAVSVPPSRLSARPYQLRQPAALLGFSRGEHVDQKQCTLFSYPDGTESCTVPHIRFTHLATSMQQPKFPPTANSSDDEGSALAVIPAEPALQTPVGFVEHSPEGGMSGGAVVDLSCGLWGIVRSRSKWGVGGAFVRMTAAVEAVVLAEARRFSD